MRARTRWRAGVLLFGLLFATFAVERGNAASDPEREIAPRDEGATAAPGTAQHSPSVGLGAPSNWQVYTGRSVDDEPKVELVTSSQNAIRGKDGTFRPTLVLRCKGGDLEVSVVTGLPAKRLPGTENEHAVSLRIGDRTARDLRVRSRFERRSLLLEPPGDVIREMLENDRLTFSFTSVSQWLVPRIVEMSFDLSGLRDVAPRLSETCPL